MKGTIILLFTLATLGLMAQERPKVLVLTDIGGDTDDQQSLVRLLLYADVLDITGIIATSTMGHGLKTHPELVHEAISYYSQVYPVLQTHSMAYPKPSRLAAQVKNGHPDFAGFGPGLDSEGSTHIIDVVMRSDDPVYIVVWGGHRELVQALWHASKTLTPENFTEFCSKIRVHGIGDQDGHRDALLRAFPGIRYVASAYFFPGASGEPLTSVFRGMYQTGDLGLQDQDWVRTHVHGHGPLADFYPIDGHGVDGMKEGDTPSFLALIPNGLNIPEKPHWGGWGGRFRYLRNDLYIDALDFDNGIYNERHTVSRWRLAFQRDFMARLARCVKPFANTNHPPTAWMNGVAGNAPLSIKAKPGDTILFTAEGSADPDGDELTFHWFNYWEAGSYPGRVGLSNDQSEASSFTVPLDADNGTAFHIVLEVSDNGTPQLVSYRRAYVVVD